MKNLHALGLGALLAVACSSEPASTPHSPSAAGANQAPAGASAAALVLDKTPWGGCVATVRGALGKLDGIRDIAITVGNRNFDVEYDQAKVDVDRMLAALKAAGEPAKVRK